MEGKNFEGRQTWKEKSKKDVEEVEDDYSDEEETSGGGGGLMLRFEENERQKKAAAAGRRGSGGGGGGGVSQPSCQAERCGADLVDAKRYHRRHKVCEFHSKAAVVIVSGTRQRFCQQCSRFHELIEFDEAKRSCRRRLAGHNERRRKSSGEPYGESSSRRGVGHQYKESQTRYQITPPGNSSSKHCQIR
ncbi:unnamed protein product [Malus baccata var. baccata]|uniref:SBP-type domain-containing protein n=2 Tax=Malus TaxID=3749 RepID=A0A540KJE1_MALBA|nr:SPL domain class transcription factor 4 [Malus hybrid cultivar]TQD74331.1 hypothetical protein C1H46_040148 [Malus baccata]